MNSIPVCEEHDNAGYDFRIQVECPVARFHLYGGHYANESQKLYINCCYKVKMPIELLNVRIIPVYSDDTSMPVLRCPQHLSKELGSKEIIRNSLVRCKNYDATYYGSDTGRTIKDRYSVVVPLNDTIKTSDGCNYLKQQLILNLTCNSSCLNREEISIIFLLESVDGAILAQRVLPVNISKSQKSDEKVCVKRRPTADFDICPSQSKMEKYDESCAKEEVNGSYSDDPSDDSSGDADAEYEDDDDDGDSSVHNGLGYEDDIIDANVENETGEFVLTFKYHSRQQMLQCIRVLYGNAITNEVFYRSKNNNKPKRESELFKRIYLKALRLKVRHAPADCT